MIKQNGGQPSNTEETKSLPCYKHVIIHQQNIITKRLSMTSTPKVLVKLRVDSNRRNHDYIVFKAYPGLN
jgi:hypothetical protein